MPDFEVKIKTPVELQGAKQLAEELERARGKAIALGESTEALDAKLKSVNNAIAGAGEAAKKTTEATGEFLEGHHGIHAIGHGADMVNRVNAGRGTPDEEAQTASLSRQGIAAHETGPQAGIDAADAVAKANTIASNLYGQRGSPQQMQEVHAVLDQIIGFQGNHSSDLNSQRSQLNEAMNRLSAIENPYAMNRTSP